MIPAPRFRILFVPACILTLGLAGALSACGGGGESDEAKIEQTIEKAALSANPADCEKYGTLRWMEETTFTKGAEAKKKCEEQAPEETGRPHSVTVTNLDVHGTEATANVAFSGGKFNSDTAVVTLVESEGNWKLDHLVGFVTFNSTPLVDALAEQLRKEPGITPEEVNCVVENVRAIPSSELEHMILSGNTHPVIEAAESCESSHRKIEEAEQSAQAAEQRAVAAELKAERAEQQAEEATGSGGNVSGGVYPHAVQQNILQTCLTTSGGQLPACECALASLERHYSLKELLHAEADLPSGELRSIMETAVSDC